MHDYGWPEVFPREPSNLISENEQREYPWIFKCGEPKCYWQTAHATEELARETKAKHTCGQENRMPKPSGNHSVPPGPSILERIWVHLDGATTEVMELRDKKKSSPDIWDVSDEKSFNEARGNARGLALAVFELSHPGYPDANEVVKTATARYKAKVAGESMPPTVGVDGHNPHLARERSRAARTEAKTGTPAAPTSEAPVAQPADNPVGLVITKKGGKVLSETDIDAIKRGLAGNLPAETLATVYKITIADVEKIKATV
jgi:hypothetical protein